MERVLSSSRQVGPGSGFFELFSAVTGGPFCPFCATDGPNTPLFLGSLKFGDGPWRLSGEKVCAIRGDSRGERLHWNVFFLLVNARARPMREGKRWNLTQGPPRFVPTLFEPPIRVQTGGRPRQVQFSTGECQENARFPRLISVARRGTSDSEPHLGLPWLPCVISFSRF